MRNLRISDTYTYLFLGCEPKTSFESGEVIPGSFRLEALMVDPLLGGEKPETISVTIPHDLEGFEVGQEVLLLDPTCSLYRLDNGRTGLSWKAVRAGTSDQIYGFQEGVIA